MNRMVNYCNPRLAAISGMSGLSGHGTLAAMLALCDNVSITTGTGNKSYTGATFTPKAMIVFTTMDTGTVSGRMSIGFATSSTSRATAGFHCVTAGATSDTQRVSRTDAVVAIPGAAVDTYSVVADLVSFNSNGFTLNWSTNDRAAAFNLGFLLLGGNALAAVGIISATSPTSTGNQSYTGVGFAPDAVILLSSAGTADWLTGAALGVGFAITSTERACCCFASSDAVADAEVTSKQLTNKALTITTGAASTLIEADLVTLDDNGLTLNWTTVDAAARRFYALCLRGGRYRVGSDTAATSVTTKATPGVGFTPAAVLTQSFSGVANTSVQGRGAYIFGAGANAGGTADNCSVALDDDGAATMAATMYQEVGANIEMWDETDLVLAAADISAFGTDGFTENWTVADSTARQFVYMAVG